jgi:hypothetical protein
MIRSEKKSLNSLDQVITAMKNTSDTDELATLLLTATELYSDGEFICEEKQAFYGEGTQESKTCWLGVNRGRDALLQGFRDIIETLKNK